MHKKLGPLEAWQWAAILAGLMLVYYEYEKSKASSAAATGGTSPTDTSGPIDPTTGLPYATDGGGVGGGYVGTAGSTGAATDSGTSLQQELSDLGSIEGLMSGLGLGAAPAPTDTSSTDTSGGSDTTAGAGAGLSTRQTNTLNTDLKTLNKTLKKQSTAITRLQKALKPKRSTKPANHKNPGHHVTTHPGGKKTATSSAPHNGQQHKNIAPPSHQRAPARHKRKPRPRRAGGHN